MMQKIIAIVGMSGTGKSTAAHFLKDKYHFDFFYFGGVILKKMKQQRMLINSENEKKAREELRYSHGKEFLVKFAIEEIAKTNNTIVLDGLYSFTEYKILKEKYPNNFILLAIHVNKSIRYERLSQRKIRPLTKEEVDYRDYSEIENIEKGGPIAIADYHIINNGEMSQFEDAISKLIEEILQ